MPMFINEILQGRNVKIKVDINGETSTFSGFVFYVFDNKILISKLTKNELPINFGSHTIDLYYVSPYDEEQYIFKACNIKLVKYKGNLYHQISTDVSSVQVNRRKSYRHILDIEGVIKFNRNTIGITIRDISNTGIAIITPNHFEVQDTFEIMFKDEGNMFEEKIRVVRIQQLGDKFLYGCEFVSLNPNIEKYIKMKQKIESV